MFRMPDFRIWKSDGARPCKRCKEPIAKGDMWLSQFEGWSRCCRACVMTVNRELEAMQVKRNIEHRRAVRLAVARGEILA